MKRLQRWGWRGVLLLVCLGFAAWVAAEELEVERADATEQAPATVTVPAQAPDADADNVVDLDAPTPHAQGGRIDDVVALGKDVLIARGETSKDVVVMGGKARVEGDVQGNLVVLSGKVQITGRVRGSVVCVFGGVTLGPTARVRDNVVSIGGRIDAKPGSRIDGQRVALPLDIPFGPRFRWMEDWFSKGLFFARPLAPQLTWSWGAALFALMIYLLIALIFPRPLQRSVDSLEQQPLGSLVAGMLGFLLIAPVLGLLFVTLVGIPAIPLLILGLIAAFVFGKVAVYRYTGEQLGRRLGAHLLTEPLWAIAAGTGCFCLLYFIPVIGFLAWGLVTVLGFGAVLLALFGGSGREKRALSSLLPNPPGGPPRPTPSPAQAPPVAPSSPLASEPRVPPASPQPELAAVPCATSATLRDPLRDFPALGAPPLAEAPATAAPAGAKPPPLVPPPLMPPPPLGSPGSTGAGAPRTPPASGPAPSFGSQGHSKAEALDYSTLPRARFSHRCWAALIDVVFVEVVLWQLLLHDLFRVEREQVFLLIAYFAGMWMWRGTTLGGTVMKLKVVRLDGRPLKAEVAIIRSLASVLSCMPLFLGFIWAAWDSDGQTWHDKIAGTMVVSLPSAVPLI